MPTDTTPPFTRESPSPRYREHLEMYKSMHRDGDRSHGIPSSQMFDGRSLAPHAATIGSLIARFGARSLLDYGAGKGGLYMAKNLRDASGRLHADIRAFWNISNITLYDPGYEPYSAYPTGRFDAVICTDVLEHVPEEDLPWLVGELFGFADMFVFANVAAYPAAKHLPNGENAHCTIKPPEWWHNLFAAAASRAGNRDGAAVRWFVLHDGRDAAGKKNRTSLQG